MSDRMREIDRDLMQCQMELARLAAFPLKGHEDGHHNITDARNELCAELLQCELGGLLDGGNELTWRDTWAFMAALKFYGRDRGLWGAFRYRGVKSLDESLLGSEDQKTEIGAMLSDLRIEIDVLDTYIDVLVPNGACEEKHSVYAANGSIFFKRSTKSNGAWAIVGAERKMLGTSTLAAFVSVFLRCGGDKGKELARLVVQAYFGKEKCGIERL
jgi:hypothetical protein